MTLGMDELMKLRAQKQAEAPYIPDEDNRRGYAALMRNTAKKVPTDLANTETGSDGFLYCTICGGKRQTKVDLPDGTTMKAPCLCKCMTEKAEESVRMQAEKEHAMEIADLRAAAFAGMDKCMANFTFAADDRANPKVSAGMQSYCENFPRLRRDGKGILLYGDVGTGKSFFAACIVNELVSKGYRCRMTTFSRLTNQISAIWNGKMNFIDELATLDLISIDDLGVERDTEYMNEHITTIVDTLYRAKVPMVITSNFSPQQMTEECDIRRKRIYDRLLERCHPVMMVGESRRKNMGRNDYREMKSLLGV